jgi:ketosteroid isomerase-like protein
VEDRLAATREVIGRFDFGDEWEACLDPRMPAELDRFVRETVEAYRRVDLDWLLAHTHPDIEIAQMPELPDTHSHYGHEGFIDAMLDWPRQWNDFRLRPHRIFSPGDDHFVVCATHSGRSRTIDIYVEAEIFFLMRCEDDLLTNWDMFMTEEEALGRAAERRAHRDDDHAAQGDRRERA